MTIYLLQDPPTPSARPILRVVERAEDVDRLWHEARSSGQRLYAERAYELGRQARHQGGPTRLSTAAARAMHIPLHRVADGQLVPPLRAERREW